METAKFAKLILKKFKKKILNKKDLKDLRV